MPRKKRSERTPEEYEAAREARRKWNEANRERVRASRARWNAANAEKEKARKAAWRCANVEKARASVKRCEIANPEKKKASAARWHAAHREEERQRKALWRRQHVDEERARAKKWAADNPVKHQERVARWRQKNVAWLKAWLDKTRVKRNARRRASRAIIRNKLVVREAFVKGPTTLSQNAIYAKVSSVVSRGLPDYMRDDVIGEMLLAVLEGSLLMGRIDAECARFVRAYNRMFDQFGTISLDAEIPGTDGLTYADRLSYEEQTGL